MDKYILINHERVFLHAIATFEYNQEMVEEGDIVDREPAHPGGRLESLKITLVNGRILEIEGENASQIAEALEETAENIASVQFA